MKKLYAACLFYAFALLNVLVYDVQTKQLTTISFLALFAATGAFMFMLSLKVKTCGRNISACFFYEHLRYALYELLNSKIAIMTGTRRIKANGVSNKSAFQNSAPSISQRPGVK